MTLLAVSLVTAGVVFAFSGVNLIRGRNGPDQTNPVAGAVFLVLGLGLLLLAACILVS